MNVGFIGAGKVGSGFGRYLRAKGISVSGYLDLDHDVSLRASLAVEGSCFDTMDALLEASDVIMITTPDDAICETCIHLSEARLFSSHHLIGHMSGAATCDLLQSAADKGACVFSLHPLQAFANVESVVKQLESTYFGLEVNESEPEILMFIMKSLGNPYFKLTSDQKANYHMAAVIVSNYLTTLMDFGLTIFEKAGISREKGWQALMPLVMGALQNMSHHPAEEALTGPIARGDVSTIQKHLQALNEDPNADAFYRVLGLETLKLAQKHKLKEPQKVEAIRTLLEEER